MPILSASEARDIEREANGSASIMALRSAGRVIYRRINEKHGIAALRKCAHWHAVRTGERFNAAVTEETTTATYTASHQPRDFLSALCPDDTLSAVPMAPRERAVLLETRCRTRPSSSSRLPLHKGYYVWMLLRTRVLDVKLYSEARLQLGVSDGSGHANSRSRNWQRTRSILVRCAAGIHCSKDGSMT